jgi:hypothetical protein
MPLKCVFCGSAHLPSESCGRDTEGGLTGGPSARLERARAVLSEASAKAGVEYRPPRDLPMPKAEFQAPAQSSGSMQAKADRSFDYPYTSPPLQKVGNDPDLTKAPADGAAQSSGGFDRAAYQRAYMRAYRARRAAAKEGS